MMATDTIKAPFPYFGGKGRVAPIIWGALGDVKHYVEPFMGSAAVLLARPHYPFIGARAETVTDANGEIVNFYRAVRADAAAVMQWAHDVPPASVELWARHDWMVKRRETLNDDLLDVDYCDPRAAGYTLYGMSLAIGHQWTSYKIGSRIHASDFGVGLFSRNTDTAALLERIQKRLAQVRVLCGDWQQPLKPWAWAQRFNACGVFLDPPYSQEAERNMHLYGANDSGSVANDVREWCIEHGAVPNLRIVLAGYEGEHDILEQRGWRVVEWSAQGGYGNQGNGRGAKNRHRERLWLSPNCIGVGASNYFEEWTE